MNSNLVASEMFLPFKMLTKMAEAEGGIV